MRLEFQNISLEWGKGEYCSATVILGGVRAIRRFGEPMAQLTMEGDGEVLQFRRGEGTALLLVQWATYQPNTDAFVQYEIDYAAFSITAEKQNGFIA